MPDFVPAKRPQLDPLTAWAYAQRAIIDDLRHSVPTSLGGGVAFNRAIADCPVVMLAVRGYYADTYKRPDLNDYNVYDDAMFLFDTGRLVGRFNWNTDPSKIGRNASIDKDYAMLRPGCYPFVKGPHHPGKPNEVARAFRQPSEAEAKRRKLETYFDDPRAEGKFSVLRVARDEGVPEGKVEWGMQNINIHPGGLHGTSSAGCQTCPREQWDEARDLAYARLDERAQTWLLYVLINADYRV